MSEDDDMSSAVAFIAARERAVETVIEKLGGYGAKPDDVLGKGIMKLLIDACRDAASLGFEEGVKWARERIG